MGAGTEQLVDRCTDIFGGHQMFSNQHGINPGICQSLGIFMTMNPTLTDQQTILWNL
jgi:hypothetical protein